MTPTYMWIALFAAVTATIFIRISAVNLAQSPIFNRLNEETLSRVFPLVILFILVFKEAASSMSVSISAGVLKIAGIGIVTGLHFWKRNLFISVIGGTTCYLLINQLF